MANTDLDLDESSEPSGSISGTSNSSPTRKRPSENNEVELFDSENGILDKSSSSTSTYGKFYKHRKHTEETTPQYCASYLQSKPTLSIYGGNAEKLFDNMIASDPLSKHISSKSYEKRKTLGLLKANPKGCGPSLSGSGYSKIPEKDKLENLKKENKAFPTKFVNANSFYGSSQPSTSPYFSSPCATKGSTLNIKSKPRSLLASEPVKANVQQQQKTPSLLFSSSTSPSRAAFSPKPITPNQNAAHRRLDFGGSQISEKENSPVNPVKPQISNGYTFTPKKSFYNEDYFDIDKIDDDRLCVTTKDKKYEVYNIGFRNYGNTCYLNSALQCLVGLKPFCCDVKSEMASMSILLPQFQTLLRFIEERNAELASLAVREFRRNVISNVDSSFRGEKQQDSSEFLNKILARLSDDIIKTNKEAYNSLLKGDNANSFIEINFEAKVSEKYTCKSCEKIRDGDQRHLLWYLSIVEPNEGSHSVSLSIQSLMEQTLGSHPSKCINCEEEEGACLTKLVTLPRVLVVQLKRYDNTGDKVSTPVAISPFLDLDRFVAEKHDPPKPCCFPKDVCTQISPKDKIIETTSGFTDLEQAKRLSMREQQRMQQDEEEQIREAMRQSLLENNNIENWDEDDARRVQSLPTNLKHCYRLVGVINHLGYTANSGHYTANVYRSEVDRWFEYDDFTVREISGADVFGRSSQKNCYILFYMHRATMEEVGEYENRKQEYPSATYT